MDVVCRMSMSSEPECALTQGSAAHLKEPRGSPEPAEGDQLEMGCNSDPEECTDHLQIHDISPGS